MKYWSTEEIFMIDQIDCNGSRHVGPAASSEPSSYARSFPSHRGRTENNRVRATATTGRGGKRTRDLAVSFFSKFGYVRHFVEFVTWHAHVQHLIHERKFCKKLTVKEPILFRKCIQSKIQRLLLSIKWKDTPTFNLHFLASHQVSCQWLQQQPRICAVGMLKSQCQSKNCMTSRVFYHLCMHPE